MNGKNYLVICDNNTFDSENVLQIVSKARKLSDIVLGQVYVLCIGEKRESAFENLIEYGADVVIWNKCGKELDYCIIASVACEMINKHSIGTVLVPASDIGRAVASVMSVRLQAGLTADCIDIFYDDEMKLNFSRAALNDSVVAVIQCINCNISMCTVKENAFPKEKAKVRTNGYWKMYEYVSKENVFNEYSVLEVMEEIEYININKYTKVFCIGRGIEDTGTLNKIIKFAKEHDIGVVATRAVVEKGYLSKECQVGQSGKSISPKLYIGFGVSGASQHMVGIKNCDIIVAINNDSNATIFDYCNYAIIEDANSIVDALLS